MPFAVGLWRTHPTRVHLQLTIITTLTQNANMFRRSKREFVSPLRA